MRNFSKTKPSVTRFPPARPWATCSTGWAIACGGFRKPALKKIPETDVIFDNVHARNAAADVDTQSLRISIDAKAVLKLGELSRRGSARGTEPVKAQDKNMDVKGKLIPFGILEVLSGAFTIVFGTSRETSDFIVDCLELWWSERKSEHADIRRLVINLDNGPELSSGRTQFLKRLTEFADRECLEIHLVYYPPYHSKYNAVERCWGILESHWNGALLIDRDTAIEWAKTMTWKGVRPIVKVLEKVFSTGVSVAKKAFGVIQQRLERNPALPKWDLRITPQTEK